MRAPQIAKWPFLLGDALLLGAGVMLFTKARLPFGTVEVAAVVICASLGAFIAVLPFILDFRVLSKLVESEALTTAISKIEKVDQVAAQIGSATSQWQTVQESAEKTTAAARQISERIAAEAKAFADFMQKVNDSEKANMKLEIEKLKRAEADWLQVVIRILDHVYALHQGAMRSKQPNLIAQLSQFQNACRDAARRIGLSPFTAEPGEFDPATQRVLEGETPGPGALVAETIAAGYNYQGRLLRPALVRMDGHVETAAGTEGALTEPSSPSAEGKG